MERDILGIGLIAGEAPLPGREEGSDGNGRGESRQLIGRAKPLHILVLNLEFDVPLQFSTTLSAPSQLKYIGI